MTEIDNNSLNIDDDYYSINSEDEALFIDYLDEDETKQIYDNGNRVIYKCLIKYIIEAVKRNEIIFSENNRMVDNERVKSFSDFETNKCDPIILAKRLDKKSTFDIIDGQHRISFFTSDEFLNNPNKNKIMNDFIPIDIRICNSESDFKKYIDSTNNRKNFTSCQLRTFKYPLLHELLNLKLKNNIFMVPYIKIDEEQFKKILFKTKFFDNFDNTPEKIVDKIIQINLFIKNQEDITKLSPEKNMTKKSYKKERDKAEKLNLFICLDSKLRFLNLLDYPDLEWNNLWNSFFKKKIKILKN